ncbi:hypothetical protein GRF29_44g64513 [Pseudopithomyces chartarum]|uniref:Uncharacterized protein n=1 Tax=Pseudopithomyces chartarum TaxID=1892770 RepID=A0AAN6LYK5_9PLEO|nr:hypothetical protein GRF29_44g64513 [Pseudopithomyces chartarum]
MVKGKVMQLQNPVSNENRNDPIRGTARNVAMKGSEQHVASLLGLFRSVFAIFEYLNNDDTSNRVNQVRNNIRTQLGFVEQGMVTAYTNLRRQEDIDEPLDIVR